MNAADNDHEQWKRQREELRKKYYPEEAKAAVLHQLDSLAVVPADDPDSGFALKIRWRTEELHSFLDNTIEKLRGLADITGIMGLDPSKAKLLRELLPGWSNHESTVASACETIENCLKQQSNLLEAIKNSIETMASCIDIDWKNKTQTQKEKAIEQKMLDEDLARSEMEIASRLESDALEAGII